TIGYSVLAYGYTYLDRFDEAENVLQRAAERKLEIPDFIVQRYFLAFLKGDAAGMQRETTLAQGNPRVEDWISNHQAFVQAYGGHLQEARRMSQRAVQLAEQEGQRERASLYETGAALREAFFGNTTSAGQSAKAALKLSKARDVEYGAAIALAISGDLPGSQALTNDLEKRFPQDTSVRFSYLPTLRALLATKQGEPSKAIELLQVTVPDELGAPESSLFGFFGALYPVYMRGAAYLALRRGSEAAAEFQKIIDHRGIVVSDPIGVLAQLCLGRAYRVQGDTAKARAAYQNFLSLWKDADPDIPILIQAKTEYAKLQ
ncbi:MAG: hypothetical protein ACRD36_06455, partial [Candidatus Acidiferrum sp.]